MKEVARASEHLFGQPVYCVAWTVTARQVELAESMAGKSGLVTDVLLIEEVGRMLVRECPGPATVVLSLEAVIMGEVWVGLPLRTEVCLLSRAAARRRVELGIEVSSAEHTILRASATVQVPMKFTVPVPSRPRCRSSRP